MNNKQIRNKINNMLDEVLPEEKLEALDNILQVVSDLRQFEILKAKFDDDDKVSN